MEPRLYSQAASLKMSSTFTALFRPNPLHLNPSPYLNLDELNYFFLLMLLHDLHPTNVFSLFFRPLN